MDQTDRQNAGSATLFRRLCMIPMGLALLSGCGGGGGGSGIQSPPVTHDAARVGTPYSPLIWITDSDEFNAQKGLSVIQSSAAYKRGFSGREIRTAIIDSGVDSTHAEFDHPDGGHACLQAETGMVIVRGWLIRTGMAPMLPVLLALSVMIMASMG